jgi:hypothetical protein
MKRRRLLLILNACVASITIALLVWPREREPEYNSVELSKWLERYNDKKPHAAEAIRHIGTNALPFLLHWIQYETPGWRNALDHLHTKLPSSVQKARPVQWLFKDKAEYRAELSVEGFSP